MFSSIRRMISVGSRSEPGALERQRRATYAAFLGEPEYVFRGQDDQDVVIEAYGRDFSPTEAMNEGYVLLTNGMSDRKMRLANDAAQRDVEARAELMWYVREPTPEIVANLRWLAQFPFIDDTYVAFGHRIPMPGAPLSDCPFKTFLFLTPIIRTDQQLSDALRVEKDKVDILTVNLISDAEYAFIKRDGLDGFLDILDERDYPVIFDPARRSYL
ncbi:suppressor of fused domain protein [uncultured Agrobacterium sp.]|uniref:suppressor of fused domain protein n=1 Tax=uncultured Agrobacterium sp. TaxID=157277 RepID=UPI002583B863|nr:suppressor of fused domain protein [uncultured Agrobacterium sp.]